MPEPARSSSVKKSLKQCNIWDNNVSFAHVSMRELLRAGNMLYPQQQWPFPTCYETNSIGFSFLNHTAEITEEPIVMLSGNKRLKKHFVWRSVYQLLHLQCRHSVKGEHRKSHLRNSYDCYHGVLFCGVLAECVHLIGFSQHSSAQREGKNTQE